MKCPNCDRGRVNGGGVWTKCEACGGTCVVDGAAVAVPPTLETVIAAGYSRDAAMAIVAREKRKAERGEKPYGTNDPLPEVWNANVAAESVPLKPENIIPGKTLVKARMGSGLVMTVTADLKDGEVGCEWTVLDDKGNSGKNSGVFRIATLDEVPPADGPGGNPGT